MTTHNPIDTARETLNEPGMTRAQLLEPETSIRAAAERLRGEVVDIYPAHYEDRAWRVSLPPPRVRRKPSVNAVLSASKPKPTMCTVWWAKVTEISVPVR